MKAGVAAERLSGQTPRAPSNGSSTVTRPMIPIAPPAAAMFAILALKLQVPRSTRTILPASDPAANGSQPSRLPPAPLPYWTGWFASVKSRACDHGWWTASYGPAIDAGAVTIIAKLCADGVAVWATEMSAAVAAGVPVTYGLSPLLPAEPTTMTP